MNMKRIVVFLIFWSLSSFALAQYQQVTLLDEEFDGLLPGMFSSGVIGAHAEYHYLTETAPKENWVVSCFRPNSESQRS